MRTIYILLLFCLVTLDVMGQKTITRQKDNETTEQESGGDGKVVSKKMGGGSRHRGSSTKSKTDLQAEIRTLLGNMVYVEGGTFAMGATQVQGTDAEKDEMPAHMVTLSSFYICKYEVTQALWRAVMDNRCHFSGDNLPVESVSWNDCQKFISKLNSLTGKKFRLPTEAEWEFAARGGNKGTGYKFSGTNYVVDMAWFFDNSDSQTHAVGSKAPNELGIYDMSGNVYEWCSDWYGPYTSSAQTNPAGPATGSYRVVRGGSWFDDARSCRTSNRYKSEPNVTNYSTGFRLAMSD